MSYDSINHNVRKTVIQFLKFSLVGISNTIISYLIYIISLKIFQTLNLLATSDYLISSIIAFVLSVFWSFYWNNRFTFQPKLHIPNNLIKILAKTYASYSVTGLFLHNILLYIWIDQTGISKELAPIINLIVTVPLNFFLNKFWVFH